MRTWRAAVGEDFLTGVRACLPMLMGAIPFGMVCGAAAVAAGLSAGQAFSLSWMVFAGSSQIVFTQLLAAGAPAWVAVLTGWVVNLRFTMYSLSMAPHCRTISPRRRWLAAYLLTDQAFALSQASLNQRGAAGLPFYFGAAWMLWLGWQASSLVGILIGALVPASWSLDFSVALTFIAILAPVLRDRHMAIAAVVAAIAVLWLEMPLRLDMLAGALLGAGVAMLAERRWPTSRPGR